MKLMGVLLLILSGIFLSTGCHTQGHSESTDPSITLISTKEELQDFFCAAVPDQTGRLTASISMNHDMLHVSGDTALCLDGNGFTLSGDGACVIRLGNNSKLQLNNINIHGDQYGIGLLGNASISASETLIQGDTIALDAIGSVQITSGSNLECSSYAGTALRCASLTVDQDAKLICSGMERAIDTSLGDLLLKEDAAIEATAEGYEVVKVGGSLTMEDNSLLNVENLGEYHGAEVGFLHTSGTPTIHALGGEHGVGVFFRMLTQDTELNGFCEPKARAEYGEGELIFLDNTEL